MSTAEVGGQTAALEGWLRANNGHLHPSVSISVNTTSGLHWRANAPISTGTSLITVPHSLALSYLNALVDDAFPVFKQQRHRLKIENIGFFYLMTQYVNRGKSFWKPYLDLLPSPDSELLTPLWFREQPDLDWLEGTDVLHTAKGRLEVYEQYYASGVEMLNEAGIDTTPYTWDLFLWAVTMFTSRSFSSNAIRPQDSKYWTTYKQSPEGGRRQAVLLDMSRTSAEDLDFSVLFPVLDAGNHNLNTKVDWTFDPGRFNVTSLEDYSAGQEVYNNYGAWKGNSELFLGYGFCIPSNPNDTVMLTLKPPPPELQAALRSIHPGYFHPNGDWAGEKATFHIKAPSVPRPSSDQEQIFGDLPEPLLEILLYMLFHERSLPVTFIARPHEYLLSMTNQDGTQYKPFVARALVQSLAPKLAKLESVSLPSQPANPKQATAAIYRASQLDILRNTIDALKSFTRSLLIPLSIPGPRLLTLENLLAYFKHHAPANTDPTPAFLTGIAAAAGTSNLSLLRSAGWEQDVFVLLLCYMFLSSTSPDETTSTAPSWLPMPPRGIAALTPDPAHTDGNDDDAAQDLLQIIHAAAAADTAASATTVWADERWSAGLIARFGGEIVRALSFAMMVPVPGSAREEQEARMVVYVHG